jgi:hypothetical protein
MKRRRFSPKSSRAPSFRLFSGERVGYYVTQSARSSGAEVAAATGVEGPAVAFFKMYPKPAGAPEPALSDRRPGAFRPLIPDLWPGAVCPILSAFCGKSGIPQTSTAHSQEKLEITTGL